MLSQLRDALEQQHRRVLVPQNRLSAERGARTLGQTVPEDP